MGIEERVRDHYSGEDLEDAELLQAAGFSIDVDEDRSASLGPPPAGELTPGDFFGPGLAERLGNNLTATFSGIVGPVLMVARAT